MCPFSAGAWRVRVAFCAFLMTLAGCAVPEAAEEVRLLITLSAPATDAVTIAADASSAARMPVRYLAAVSPLQHALVLACDDRARCAAAVQRMRNDSTRFKAVEIDARKFRH